VPFQNQFFDFFL